MVDKFSGRMKYNYSLPVAQNTAIQQSEPVFSLLRQIRALYALSPEILSNIRPFFPSAFISL